MRPILRYMLAWSIILVVVLVAAVIEGVSQTKRPIAVDDLFRFKRLSDPELSPDGKYIAYVVGTVDKEANRTNTDVWLVPTSGGEPRAIAASPFSENHPRWSPDSKTLSYLSTSSGTAQIYLYDIVTGATRQLTNHYSGASLQMFSPDGTMIAFVSSVYPEYSTLSFVECQRRTRERDEAREQSKMKGVVFDRLLYRHWDSWTDFKRMHIFVVPVRGGEPRNLTPGDRDAVPNSSTFSAGDDFHWSPDSKEIAYSAGVMPAREEAWRTNLDIVVVDVQTGAQKTLTGNNLAADAYPRYSPDGKWLAYRAQSRAGCESDKWDIILLNRANGSTMRLTNTWDYSVEQIEWTADSKTILADVQDNAESVLYALSVDGKTAPRKLTETGAASAISVAQNGSIAFAHSTLTRPHEIMLLNIKDKQPVMKQITSINSAMLADIVWGSVEKISYMGAEVRNQAWMVLPPNFDVTKKYPVVFLIHGGPQSAWLNSWSNRWNMQVWAAQGYVIVAPNPTGSTGFGQKFVDAVSKNWGGTPYRDIMQCVDYVLRRFPFLDSTKMAAAGASYGGYMVNWMNTQTNRFKAFVSHCGVYNFHSMYGTTDEVWFDEWEHGIPWENPDFDTYSPHKFIQHAQTPTLIIHTGNDFRVPLQEGIQYFTALQRRGVPSRFLYIPDEGHWVLKPQNSAFWHTVIFEWLAQYLKT
ncbi:MAG: S9 family peptidase [Bacteroidota bacterium]|nr:S9 family peptidase [Candidatus Kapabacteria bacterium]MDW8220050.1 S9 family peptidase [Bacteroidota bacterium]